MPTGSSQTSWPGGLPMPIRRRPAPGDSHKAPVGASFHERFVRDAHTIVAEGFARLVPANLAVSLEPDISGMIVSEGRAWMDLPTTPAWTSRYFLTEEKAEDASALRGTKRPRIDIHIESNERRPRPRFVFEAKRLYRPNSVAAYVGKSGLGQVLDGSYAAECSSAGMLGYVQNHSVDHYAGKLERKLTYERAQHHLAPNGPIWDPVTLDVPLGDTRRSHHTRPKHGAIDVYHSFLKCFP